MNVGFWKKEEMRDKQIGDQDYWVKSFINPLLQMGMFDHHIKGEVAKCPAPTEKIKPG